MAVTIDGTTGVSAVQAGVVVQADLAAGVAGNGPAFSAYGNVKQNISTVTFTKVTFGVEDYDTNSNFASSRFTPTVAGYYQLNLRLQVSAVTALTRIIGEFRSNGDSVINGRCIDIREALGTLNIISASSILYLNGSTDYCEIFVYADGAGQMSVSGTDKNTCFFQAALIRGA